MVFLVLEQVFEVKNEKATTYELEVLLYHIFSSVTNEVNKINIKRQNEVI